MKRFTISFLFVLSILLAVGSNDVKSSGLFGDLNNDGEVNIADVNLLFDVILNGQPQPAFSPNMTIAEFKANHWQDTRNYIDTVTQDEIIHGWVTSSDEADNIYKTLYITDESGAALTIFINKTGLYRHYPIGQEIILPMRGYYVGKYNGQQVLGYPSWYAAGNTWEATFMPQALWEELVVTAGTPDPTRAEVQPVDVSLAEIANNISREAMLAYQGKLVRFTDVWFEDANGVTTYSNPHSGTNHAIVDENGNRLNVRTSNYANFSEQTLPIGKLEVVGILSTYGSMWQLYLRDSNDVTVIDGGEDPFPVIPVTMLDEGFDRTLPEDWTTVILSGDKSWYQTTFDQNGYAAISGYKGKQPPFDAWLITPALDIENAASKIMTFRTQMAAYGNTTSTFEVYVLDKKDPSSATIKVKLNPTLAAPSSTSTYSEWVESGDLDLSQWSDGIYYIGFRYYATQDVNYATWCLDDVRFGNDQ